MDRYRVKAPYVLVKTMTPDGLQVKGLYEGALVPEDASAEWIARHLRKRMIDLVGGGAPPPPQAADVPPTLGQRQPNIDVDPDPDAPPYTSPPATPSPPPESGPGSGKQAWVDYAVALGWDREEANEMSRDVLIAALREG